MMVSGKTLLMVLLPQNMRMTGVTLILLPYPTDVAADLQADHLTMMTLTVAMGVAVAVEVAVVTIQEVVAVPAVVPDHQVAQAAVAMVLREATTQPSVRTISCLRLPTPVPLLVGIHSTQVLTPAICLATR